jgi:chromosome segregation ATPase
MATKGVYETVKQAIQDLITPDLERIKAELVALRRDIGALGAEIKAVGTSSSLEKRMDEGLAGLRNETRAGLLAVNDRIDTLKERFEQSNKRMDEALDIRERLASLEARVAARGC